MAKTRWALLGAGRHAERSVIPELKKAEGAAFVAIMSRDHARGEAIARTHNVPRVYTAIDDLLRDPDIDAIYDATPDGLHARHAIAAATAGKHALIEKPLALSVEEAVAIIDASRRHKTVIGVVFNQRHELIHREARRIIQRGDIGEVKLAHVQIALRSATPRGTSGTSWRTDPAMRAGGIGVSIGDHAYDTLSYIIDQEIREIAAFTDASQSDPPNERVASMLLKMSKGAIGYACASFATPFARRPFEIHGTAGTLIIENSYIYLTGAGDDPTPVLTLVNEAGRSVQQFAATECFRHEIEQFNRAIEGNGAPMTPPEEGLRSLAIGAALYDSVKHGRIAKIADHMPI